MMADPKKGAPKVTAPDAFGGVQQLSLDSHRPLIQSESLFRFANMIAIPSRGVWGDSLMWPLVSAVVVRTVLHAVSFGIVAPAAALAFLFVVFAPLVIIICYTGTQLRTNHGMFSFYRLIQILIGFCLAMV